MKNQQKPTILVVDDNREFVQSVLTVLKEFNVKMAYSLEEAKGILEETIDVVLLDLVFDDSQSEKLDGLNFIPFIRDKYPDMQIVVMTNYSSTDITVKAIKSGATDFLNKKELNWVEWKIRLGSYANNVFKIRSLTDRNRELEKQSDEPDLIGISPGISHVRDRLADLGKHSPDVNIFLSGETGTGKNLAVKFFRRHCVRRDKPYKEFSILELTESLIESELFGHVKGAFTGANAQKKGLFELADGGILFLDEIGDYDNRIQAKILRFLDEKIITPVGSGISKKLDLQLILASNQDIPKLIKERKFREDLYQRINQVRIELPALRDRTEDIPILAWHFFEHFRVREKTNLKSIDPSVIDLLVKYHWPGNVRELVAVIWDACTRARLSGDKILKKIHLKNEICLNSHTSMQTKISDYKEKLVDTHLFEIENALVVSLGQKARAARLLGIKPDQMRYRVLKIYRETPSIIFKYKTIAECYKLST